MSVPPPPGYDPNSFFGSPMQPQPAPRAPFGYAPPVYGAPAPFGAPPGQIVSRPAAAQGRPEPVVVACTMLAVFAAIGVFTLIAVLVLGSSGDDSSGSGDSGSSVTGLGLGAIYAVLWGGSGFINAALVVFLRQGNATARLVTSVVCGLWALYWLRLLYKLSNLGVAAAFNAGSEVHLAELLLVGLAVASALPAALLWRAPASDYFT